MDKFSFGHIFFLICAVSIASQKTYPEIFMNLSGRDSWIANAIACVIMIIFFDYIIKICVKNNCYSIVKIFNAAFGRFLGKLFLNIFIFVMFLSLVESASVESSVIHTNMFVESPIWYIALFVVLPGLYVVKNGKYSVMIVVMICMSISIFNGINLGILTAKFKEYKRLFPVFENGLNINFFVSIIKTIGMYSSICIVLPYLTCLKSSKGLRKYSLIGNIFVSQMIVVSTVGLLATFNVERANTMAYAKLIQTQLVSYFGFIANGEFYVIFQTIASWFAKYIATFFAIIILLRESKVKNMSGFNIIQIILTAAVYAACYYSARKLLVLFTLLDIYIYICVGVFFILPILAFTLFNLRSKSVDSK